MDFLFIVIVISAILGVLGYAAWFVFFVWLAKKALLTSQRDLDRLLPNLEQLLRAYSNLPTEQQTGEMAHIQRMIAQANTHMNQMDDIYRQKYDIRVSELMGMASNAGINWSPP